MATDDIVFGTFVPQGWKMELVSIPDPSEKWAATVRIAQLAERSGYDSIWVYDHVHNVPRAANETVFECWTTMAALSQLTSTVRLGQMVGCAAYRNPALLAKITANVDVISGGRLDWGIGAGWYEQEYRAYGFDFPSPKDRIGILSETVQIVRSMWTEPETTFRGDHFDLRRAQCDPKPVQTPTPPIWIGGAGEQLTLRVVAKYADCSNFGGPPEVWTHKRDVLRRHCDAVGRDPDEIRMTWSPEVCVRHSDAEIDAIGAGAIWGQPVDDWRANNLVGTPEQVAEKIARYIELGCGGFVTWCSDFPDTTTLELFATEVMPEFRP